MFEPQMDTNGPRSGVLIGRKHWGVRPFNLQSNYLWLTPTPTSLDLCVSVSIRSFSGEDWR